VNTFCLLNFKGVVLGVFLCISLLHLLFYIYFVFHNDIINIAILYEQRFPKQLLWNSTNKKCSLWDQILNFWPYYSLEVLTYGSFNIPGTPGRSIYILQVVSTVEEYSLSILPYYMNKD
jgi:hypothetical protein